MTFEEAASALHALGPRFRFIKTSQPGASFLDVGAGDGSLMMLRDWPAPVRSDIQMFAWAGEYNRGFRRYQASEVGFWPDRRPDFAGRQFDAIFSANFIEHIDEPLAFVKWAAARLAARGRIYLEWPSPQSLHLPTTQELAAVGVNVMAGAYHDDATHRPEPPRAEDVAAALLGNGMIIIESGIVCVPFIDRQLAIHARRASDLIAMTLAYWSHTGWCQYLVAELR